MSALQKKLLLALSLALAVQTAVVGARYVQELGVGQRFGGDFICFWQAAVRARQGDFQAIYRPEHWGRVLSAEPSASLAWFVYPPFSLFGLQLLGGMNYARAVACWSIVPLPLYFLLLVAHAKRSAENLARVQAHGGGLGWLGSLTLAGMTLPFLGVNLLTGQVGAIVAVIFIAAAYCWPDRPLLTGLFIGLLAIKPQLGLLLPFALAADGKWRTAAVATGVVTALVAASFLWVGRDAWADYVQMTGLFRRFLSLGPGHLAQLALAPYVSLRSAGAPAAAAAVAQGAASLAALAGVVAVFRRNDASMQAAGRRDPRLDLRLALLATGALLATPYAMSYESPLLVLAVIPLFVRAWRRGWEGLELLATTGLVVMPLTQMLLVDWRVPFGLCALLLAFGVLGRRYLLEAPKCAAAGAVALPQPA
jgi:hypothetical protein